MDMDPGSQPNSEPVDGRRTDRRSYDAEIQFRKGTKRALVKLFDISRLGARITGVFLVQVDDRFFLTLPGLAPIAARVAWVTQFEFGCEFIQPLHPAILEATLNQMHSAGR